jgi:tRNA threonylcarbamoyladenosine biosynthesis protein TsaE
MYGVQLYTPCCKKRKFYTFLTEYICSMEITYGLEEIEQVADMLLKQYPENRVFAFQGTLGAGKTTFITAMCNLLGVKNPVSSPTYSIINEYNSPSGLVYHIDLYRLKDEQEAMDAGVEDALYSGNYCFVEWPEIASSLMPEDTVLIKISTTPQGKRKITTCHFQP